MSVSSSHPSTFWKQLRHRAIAGFGVSELRFSGLRQRVIPPARAGVVARFLIRLPVRAYERLALESSERGIDGAARKIRDIHDVESEFVPLRECLKDEEAGEGKGAHVRIYIVIYAWGEKRFPP